MFIALYIVYRNIYVNKNKFNCVGFFWRGLKIFITLILENFEDYKRHTIHGRIIYFKK